MPRLAKYGEHIDDHQMQISEVLEKGGYLRMVTDIEKLGEVIKMFDVDPITKKYDKPSNVVTIIDQFIQNNYLN